MSKKLKNKSSSFHKLRSKAEIKKIKKKFNGFCKLKAAWAFEISKLIYSHYQNPNVDVENEKFNNEI